MGKDETVINIGEASPESEKIQSEPTLISPSPTPADNDRPMLGRRKTSGVETQVMPEIGYDGEQNTVNYLGKLYARVMNFNVITRNIVYILPICIIFAIPLAIYATVKKSSRIGGVRTLGLFVWLEIAWLSLWVTKLIAQTFPYIFTFLCGFVSSGVRKYSLVIKALELPLSIFIWTIITWATVPVVVVFDAKNRDYPWVDTLRHVFLASIAVTALFLLEKLIIQLISINYHRRQFSARVKQSKVSVHMLDMLYDASIKQFPAYCAEFEEEVSYHHR
jgi:hypothetical protein